MPKGETKLTRQQVLAAIIAAGPGGITRMELAKKFEHLVAINAIDNHINNLANGFPGAIFKPKAGVVVAIQFNGSAAPEIAQKTTSTATDAAQAEFAPMAGEQPLPGELAGPVSYPVETLDVEQITARPVVFDTELEYPCQVEFCVFSSGGLDMLTDAGTISLSAPVLRKLRAFLGLFAEAA